MAKDVQTGFNEKTQNDKVAAGWRGGPFFQNPMMNNKLQIADGYPKSIASTHQADASPGKGSTTDTWFSRRSK